MRARALLLAAAVAAAGLTAPAAHAAKRPAKVCNLVKDPAGDMSSEVEGGVPVFPADPGLDVVGGDVASGTRNITAVVRLAAEPGDATAYVKRYIVEFKVAGQKNPMVLSAAIGALETTYSRGYSTTNPATGSPVYTYTGNAAGSIVGKVVTVTAALADVAADTNLGPVKKGAKLSAFKITANRRIPTVTQVPGKVYPADVGIGKGVYYAGNPSCVKVS